LATRLINILSRHDLEGQREDSTRFFCDAIPHALPVGKGSDLTTRRDPQGGGLFEESI